MPRRPHPAALRVPHVRRRVGNTTRAGVLDPGRRRHGATNELSAHRRGAPHRRDAARWARTRRVGRRLAPVHPRRHVALHRLLSVRADLRRGAGTVRSGTSGTAATEIRDPTGLRYDARDELVRRAAARASPRARPARSRTRRCSSAARRRTHADDVSVLRRRLRARRRTRGAGGSCRSCPCSTRRSTRATSA